MHKRYCLIALALVFACAPVRAAEPAFAEFAKSLETAFQQRDPSAFNRAWDVEATVAKALTGLTLSEKARAGFLMGTKRSSLGQQICQGLGNDGTYKLMGIRQLKGRPHALFRLVSDDGLNYHEMELARDGTGPVRITDIYIYALGERISDTFRRAALALAAEENKNIVERLAGREGDYIKNLPKIKVFQDHVRNGRHKEALAAWAQLPASVQTDKTLLVLRAAAAQHIGDAEHQEALTALEKNHPQDPCLSLMMIDAYLLRKQYDKLLASIDRLDARVGGDPYLNVLRAAAFLPRNDYAKARELAQKAIEQEPTLASPYWTLVTISLAAKEYAETARVLSLIETKLGIRLADLTKIPEYAGFVKSPEYAGWLKSHARNLPPKPVLKQNK
jgi:tetratricopeptide (TPR) repeat protein